MLVVMDEVQIVASQNGNTFRGGELKLLKLKFYLNKLPACCNINLFMTGRHLHHNKFNLTSCGNKNKTSSTTTQIAGGSKYSTLISNTT